MNSAKVITGSITLSCSWPGRRGERHREVEADHQEAGLVDDLRDHRVHLARHDRAARLHLRQVDLVEAAARARGQQADVVADLGELGRRALQHAGQQHVGAGVGGRLDQVAGQDELGAGQLGQVLRRELRVARRRRHRGADRRGAEVDLVQELPDLGDALHFLADRRAPAVELLAERHRHGVLQVGAAHLQHLVELLALGEERLLQPGQRLHVAGQAQDQREPERGRVDVVGRLPEVDVVVRVDVLVLALLVAERLQREVGDHLVGVHVGRRAGAALDEVGDELVAHLAGDQPVAGGGDRVGDLGVEHAEVAVRQRGGLLHVAEGLDEVRLQSTSGCR